MHHPLILLLATRPELLAEHARAYAELLALAMAQTGRTWRRRALLSAGVVCGMGLGTVLAGVSLLLWANSNGAPPQAPWLMWLVPGVPLATALVCAEEFWRQGRTSPLDPVRAQVQADLALWRQASSST